MNAAMVELGVPAVVYAQSRVPGGDVHRYCGSLCYPVCASLGDDALHLPDAFENNLLRLLAEVKRRRDSGGQWMELFMGHPSRMLHQEFWDGPNFTAGRNPARAQWRRPARKPDAEVALALQNLERAIERLTGVPGLDIKTIGDMNRIMAAARESKLSRAERREAEGLLDANIAAMANWVILPPGLDVSRVREVARQKSATLRRLVLG